jgi:hypothetical protein
MQAPVNCNATLRTGEGIESSDNAKPKGISERFSVPTHARRGGIAWLFEVTNCDLNVEPRRKSINRNPFAMTKSRQSESAWIVNADGIEALAVHPIFPVSHLPLYDNWTGSDWGQK